MPSSSTPWVDMIQLFSSYTEQTPSPAMFRLWAGVSLVAGALERRVWSQINSTRTFPNLFVFLVAAPGVGKKVIDEVEDLWTSTSDSSGLTQAFHMAPDSMTKASLVDALAKAPRSISTGGQLEQYHSLLVAAEEFGVLLPSYENEYITFLNKIWNNPPKYRETRRHGKNPNVVIEKPQINLLTGIQPNFMANTFPIDAWSSGLTTRILMIYASSPVKLSLLAETIPRQSLREQLLEQLSHLSGLWGPVRWDPETLLALSQWHDDNGPPVPTHAKLENYNSRRTETMIKLCVVSGLARTGQLRVDAEDFIRAKAWLFEAERLMPDIFRAMVGKSDAEVMNDLHFFATSVWARQGQKPVAKRALAHFLITKVPSDKIWRLIQAAEDAHIIQRVGGTEDQYLPVPKHLHGGDG